MQTIIHNFRKTNLQAGRLTHEVTWDAEVLKVWLKKVIKLLEESH